MSHTTSKSSRLFSSTIFSAIALSLVIAVSAPSGLAQAGELLVSGSFSGQSDHITSGKISIEKEGNKTFVILHDDFSLDGAPSPTLGFSKAGAFDEATEFAELKSLKGGQRYEIPANIAISAYDAFTVWCAKFSVPLGSAKLN